MWQGQVARDGHVLELGGESARVVLSAHAKLRRFIEKTGTDEIIVTGHIFDHAARLRSFELVAAVRDGLAA